MKIGSNYTKISNDYGRKGNNTDFDTKANVKGSSSSKAEKSRGLEEVIGKLTEEQKKYLNEKCDINKITLYNSESTDLMQDLYRMNLITKEELELYSKPNKTVMTRVPIYLGENAMSGEEESIGCLRTEETGWDEYEGLNLWEIFSQKADWGENQEEELSEADKDYNKRLTNVNRRLAELLENIFGQSKGYTGGDYVNDTEYKDYKNALNETVQSIALAKYEREQQYRNILQIG